MSEVPDYVHDVFISFNPADRAWVDGYLLDALTQAGIRCHTAAAFELGAPVIAEFERAIRESRRTLLVLSPAYQADDMSRFADLLAQSFGTETATWPVIPIILQRVELPPRLAMLVGLDASDPANWPDVVRRLLDDLHRPASAAPVPPPCPYPGMTPFRESDSGHFYGRETEVTEMVERLRLSPILAIIGPSGSGKSSLVFAGLIPTLRSSRRFRPGEWDVRSMRPGATPLATLQATVGDVLNPEVLQRVAMATARVLLVVDQFEEVFTQRTAQADEFQSALGRWVDLPGCYLVLTVRADFFADLLICPLWGRIKDHRYEVLPLDAAGLRQAIVRPAEDLGVYVEAALVERLVADAAGEPGVLPFVQETLTLLWEYLERRFLPLRAYEALVMSSRSYGTASRTGLQVAMARRADATLAALPDEQQAVARRIFLRLVQFGEGRADTRRQQPVEALRSASDDAVSFEATLQHLADGRLVTLGGGEGDARTADLAHEALISGWPTLQGWLKQRREAELVRRRLEVKAAEWVRLGRGDGGLLDAPELAEVEQWNTALDSVDLGSSAELIALVQASRSAINPGWHRGGAGVLAAGAFALVAMLGLLYIVSDRLATVLRVALWLIVLLLIGLGAWVAGLAHRTAPFQLQRYSHLIGRRPSARLAITGLCAVAIAIWAVFGIQMARTEAYCAAQGFNKPQNDRMHIAVNVAGLNPHYAELMKELLGSYLNVAAWVTNLSDAERCSICFTYRLDVNQIELQESQEVVYQAQLYPRPPGNPAMPSVVRPLGKARCDQFAELARRVLEVTGAPSPVSIVQSSSPIALTSCEAFILDSQGCTAYLDGRLQEAARLLQQAIALEPGYAKAHRDLGIVAFYMDNTRMARDAFEQASELLPDVALLFSDLGKVCYRQGDHLCAEQNLVKAVEVESASQDSKFTVSRITVSSLSDLAVIYRDQGRYPEADVVLQKANDLLSEMTGIECRGGTECRPGYEALVTKEIGILRYREGRLSDALRILKAADRADQTFREQQEEIVYYLAVIAEALGDTRAACKYWHRYNNIPSADKYGQRYGSLPAIGQFMAPERRVDAGARQERLGCGVK
jgi:tetratricopeptide (TPR) repeat protein